MTSAKHAPRYVPTPSYTQQDWDEVCDNPELIAKQIANAKPLEKVLPGFAAAIRWARATEAAPGASRPSQDETL
jgi:hypothetical protein